MKMIHFDNVSLRFGQTTLFSNLSFSIQKKSKTVLKSPSGTGKTTILNMIMGFVNPDSGLISIDGKNIDKHTIKKIRSEIAWLPQGINFPVGKTIEDVIYYPFHFEENENIKPTRGEINLLMDSLNLDKKLLTSETSTVSGGEKQRIGLIIAKLLRRKILLLDEPTSALDADTMRLVADMILFDTDLTVLSASHDAAWVDLCDSVIVLKTNGGNDGID